MIDQVCNRLAVIKPLSVLSVRPGSRWSSSGYSLANRRLYSSAFSTREKGANWDPFYQLRQVLAKGSHLLQILLKALNLQVD